MDQGYINVDKLFSYPQNQSLKMKVIFVVYRIYYHSLNGITFFIYKPSHFFMYVHK